MGKSKLMPTREKKPFWKKGWFWTLIIVFGIIGAFSEDEESAAPKEKEVKAEETAAKPNESEKPKEKKLSAAEELEKIKKEEEAKQKEKQKAKADSPLTDGENGVLAEDVFIGLGEDKKNYDEMFTYITKGNNEALAQMVVEGKVLFAAKGTPITVVDRGFINAHVQVIGTGERGWIPVEYLARNAD